MSLKALSRNEKGFTIIEVMIVLAIAGLIVLVVFLAVPALQRNSRNTQRKNDVQAVLGAIQEWISNNGSRNLPEVTDNSEIDDVVAAAGFGYYAEADLFWNNVVVTASSTRSELAGATTALKSPNPGARDRLYMWSSADCSNGALSTAVPGDERVNGAGPSRSIAIEYAIETAGGVGFMVQCRAL